MLRAAKLVTLSALRNAGVFYLVANSRWRQQRLLILCYHGTSGRFLGSVGPADGMGHAAGLTFDADGRLYVSSHDRDEIWRAFESE